MGRGEYCAAGSGLQRRIDAMSQCANNFALRKFYFSMRAVNFEFKLCRFRNGCLREFAKQIQRFRCVCTNCERSTLETFFKSLFAYFFYRKSRAYSYTENVMGVPFVGCVNSSFTERSAIPCGNFTRLPYLPSPRIGKPREEN